MSNPYYELCLENTTHLLEALAHPRVNRIELCDNLAQGGTTVSYGLAKWAGLHASLVKKPIMLMIRPRGGDFVYNHHEADIMLEDISLLKHLPGVSGFVFGALTPDNLPDYTLLQRLIHQAKPKWITFHMAFDSIPRHQQKIAIDALAAAGVDFLLVHGSPQDNPIEENIGHLQQILAYSRGKLQLIVGKKLNTENIELVASQLEGAQFHGTNLVRLKEPSGSKKQA